MHIEEAKGYRNFGIIVSTKPGQMNTKTAENAKKKLEKLGKNAFIMVFDEITSWKTIGMHLDCLVNCACPRLAEDSERLGMIVLNPEDIDMLEEKEKKPGYE
jgi:2-(3-amino-3-carboxypropyl)histidine synthase